MSRAVEMQELVTRWESSGLTQRAFAEQASVSYSVFQYWRRRLKPRDTSGTAVQLDPIRIVAGGSRPAAVFELRTAGGLTLSVPAGFDEVELGRLLGVLTAC